MIKVAPQIQNSLKNIFLVAIISGFTLSVHAGDLLVSSFNSDQVLRYDQQTGNFIKVFAHGPVTPEPGDLCFNCFGGLTYGPDGNLYVVSQSTHNVMRFDGTTGAFIDTFIPAESGGLLLPSFLIFGPDGKLYVSSFTDQVLRYDGQTGDFLDVFAEGNGLDASFGMAFGPDDNVYVVSGRSDQVLRYHGTTGTFIDVFAAHTSLLFPADLTFGPDDNLYVPGAGSSNVVRFDGQSGDFIDSFVASVSNGLSSVTSLEFGPDNKLYVLDFFANQVLRYDSHTGAFIDDFIPAGSGGLNGAVALTFVPNIAPVPTLSRQIGTPFDDTSNTIFVTADAVWIGGQTAGTLAGETSSGGLDGFVQKYTLGGTLLCTDQFGTSGDETVTGIKVDETTPDSVYVTGDTTGVLGTSSLGDSDIYVRKYDSDCNSQWTTQFGTDGTDTAGTNIGLTPDGSGIFTSGITDSALPGEVNIGGTDLFVQKLNTDGSLDCNTQFGTLGIESGGLVLNSPLLMVAATTVTGAGDTDGLLYRYDLDCNAVWNTQVATAGDETVGGLGLGPDDANPVALFVGGDTSGAFTDQTNAGATDFFVQRYDLSGSLEWTRQFGTVAIEQGRIVLNSPTVTIGGQTEGAFQGFENAGGTDIALRRYDFDGNELWTTQFGTAADDRILAMAHSPDFSRTYLVGDTQGALPGKTSAGGKDIILIALELTSDPVVLLMPLIDQVSDYNLHHGIQQSFDAKLDAALKSLNDLKQNNDTATKKALEAFINSVLAQRGKEISVADADMFIATAQEIIILLNGG